MALPGLEYSLGKARDLVDKITEGVNKFELDLDVKGLDKAQEALGQLFDTVSDFLALGEGGGPVVAAFERLATATNTISKGVGIVQDVAQGLGLAKDDGETKEIRNKRRDDFLDGIVDASPTGPIIKPAVDVIKGVDDVVSGVRTPAENATIRADMERRRQRTIAITGKSDAQLQAEYDAHWKRRNRQMGPDRSVVPAPGEMRLPDIAYPARAPAVATPSAPPARVSEPSFVPPIPTRRPSAAANAAKTIEVPITPKITDEGRAAIEAQIREIDQRLGALSQSALSLVPGGDAAGTAEAAADQMQRLMQQRDALDAKLNQPMTSAAPDINGPLVIEGQRATQTAAATGTAIQSALSVTAKPTIDTSSMDAALSKADQLISKLQSIPGHADRAARVSAQATVAQVSRTMNDRLHQAISNHFSDGGF